jgi:hypothetical protein
MDKNKSLEQKKVQGVKIVKKALAQKNSQPKTGGQEVWNEGPEPINQKQEVWNEGPQPIDQKIELAP